MQAVSWLVNWGLGAVGPGGDVASAIAYLFRARGSHISVPRRCYSCALHSPYVRRGATLRVVSLLVSTNSVLLGPRVNPLAVDLRHRAHVVFRVLPHPLVVDLGDHCGYGQRILEISSQLQSVVEVL
jgi:hypothetical protein